MLLDQPFFTPTYLVPAKDASAAISTVKRLTNAWRLRIRRAIRLSIVLKLYSQPPCKMLTSIFAVAFQCNENLHSLFKPICCQPSQAFPNSRNPHQPAFAALPSWALVHPQWQHQLSAGARRLTPHSAAPYEQLLSDR